MHLLKELSKFKIVCKANSGCGCCASMYMALPFVDDGTFLKLLVENYWCLNMCKSNICF